MNIKHNVIRNVALGLMLPAVWTASMSNAMAARPRTASATVSRTVPSGNTSTRQTTASTNGTGGYAASSTVTGPAGNTATRQSSGSYNPATKTYSRTSTSTGPNGKTASSASSTQATGNGYVHNSTHTGPNGNSATESRNVTVTPAN